MQYRIKTFNAVSEKGLSLFEKNRYVVGDNITEPHAILVRSAELHEVKWDPITLIVGRAGAGTNNIPVTKLTQLGIPVLNTPGANANAVKELVIAGLLLASRHICQAWNYTLQLKGSDEEIHKEVEKNKKQFKGFELQGKTIGIIGLGKVGVKVANATIALGMKVKGFDPTITIENAWELSPLVQHALSLDEAIEEVDFITVHVPLTEKTQNFINADQIKKMKQGAVLLNFAREEIVSIPALMQAVNEKKMACYICDFPSHEFKNHPSILTLPHLGASTEEAEENCAIMVVHQIKEFLEKGNIRNSVNFPEVFLPQEEGFRVAIVNANVPNMVAQISTVLAKFNANILNMINKSKQDIAYTLLDLNKEPSEEVLTQISKIPGVVRVRKVPSQTSS